MTLLDPREVRKEKLEQARRLIKEIRALETAIPMLVEDADNEPQNSDSEPLGEL